MNHDAVSIGEDKAVNLRFDVLHLDPRGALELIHFNLIVEVTDDSHNSIVLQIFHMFEGNDFEVPSGCGEKVHLAGHGLKRNHLEAFHAILVGKLVRYSSPTHKEAARAIPFVLQQPNGTGRWRWGL